MLSSLLRAGGLSCSLDVFHGGLVINILQFRSKKPALFFNRKIKKQFGHHNTDQKYLNATIYVHSILSQIMAMGNWLCLPLQKSVHVVKNFIDV
jgi:hypothetical protein